MKEGRVERKGNVMALPDSCMKHNEDHEAWNPISIAKGPYHESTTPIAPDPSISQDVLVFRSLGSLPRTLCLRLAGHERRL